MAGWTSHGTRRSGPPTAGARPTDEGHRATTFELLFDLVYVFAVTRVTGYMVRTHTGYGVLQGLLLLALLWWIWESFTGLGNQAYGGTLRAGGAIAIALMFIVALTIPEAWHDAPGGLDGPVVLVVAYILVRCLHLTLSAMAAADDALRRQIRITWVPELAGAALLLAGALIGGWTQTVLFAGAVLVAWGGVYLTSREGSWRVRSASHFNERHGLFILIALGESVAAIGPFSRSSRGSSSPHSASRRSSRTPGTPHPSAPSTAGPLRRRRALPRRPAGLQEPPAVPAQSTAPRHRAPAPGGRAGRGSPTAAGRSGRPGAHPRRSRRRRDGSLRTHPPPATAGLIRHQYG
jgi:hypothetical protein